MAEKSVLFQVRKDMEGFVGSRVKLKANKGRRKTVIKEGILENTYPSIFIVKLDNEMENPSRRVSYSYTDILTRTVEISVYDKVAEIK